MSQGVAEYDVGNRTSSHRSSSYGYQPFNKIASTQTGVYGSDADGNMTTKSEGGVNWIYTWDFENRVSTAAKTGSSVSYQYDALGRRVKRTQGTSITKFTNDGQDVLLDDVGGTLTKYQNGPGIDNKLKSTSGTTINYFLADHLGSTNGLTNSSGTLTASNSYDSFGNPSNTAFPSRYQFTGREYDSFSGLQFSRARFYDPNLGRFISEDPIGFRGGDVNLYGYVKNRPLRYRDPRGLDDADREFRDTDLYKELERLYKDAFGPKALSRCTKNWLKPYFPDLDLDSINIHSGIPWYVPIDADGYTDGTDIYIKPGQYKPNSIDGQGLVGHELTHTRQYQQNGNWPFKLRYLWDSAKNLGYGPEVPFEKEAYDNGKSIRGDLGTRNAQGERPCGCQGALTP